MDRFFVFALAGILIIAGGWYGWLSVDEVDATVTDVADRVGPDAEEQERAKPRGAAPEGMPTNPDISLSVTDTPVGEPCTKARPTGAAGMDRLMDALDDEPRLQGGDHGGSTLLADGRRMFVYGDTIRDPARVTPFMVRNSVLIADDGCVQPMRSLGGEAVIPDDEDNTGYWPMSLRAIAVDGGTKVQVITNRVRQTGEDLQSFTTLGSSLATFEVPTGRMPELVDQGPLSPDFQDPRVPTWGAALWDHDGTTYVFGTASNETKSTKGWSLHVARTDPEDLGDQDSWEYWDGTDWSAEAPSPSAAEDAQLIPADHGVSHVLSVFERDGSWYALSKEGDFTGDRLAVWKADAVTGPWKKHIVDSLANSSDMVRYTPLAHPDFTTVSGSLLISWSESPVDHGMYYTNPELYRPEFEEITLP